MQIRPQIHISFFAKKRKDETQTVTAEEPTSDYIQLAEEAAARLGKKLLIGAVVVVVTAAIAGAAANIATIAFEESLSE